MKKNFCKSFNTIAHQQRRVLVLVLVVFFVLFSICVWQTRVYIGQEIWKKTKFADAALFFNRDAHFAMAIGNYYFNGGAYDLKIAERAYQRAVTADNTILWGHYQLARIFFVRADFKNALIEINRELEANPENLRSLYVRGLIYGNRRQPGDLEKAAEDFLRFTRWAPSEWAGYNDLAWVLSKAGKYSQAKTVIESALSVVADAGKNPWLWNAKGLAELNLHEYTAAADSFGRALSLVEALTEVGWKKSYPGNNPESAGSGLAAFKKAIAENLQKTNDLEGKK